MELDEIVIWEAENALQIPGLSGGPAYGIPDSMGKDHMAICPNSLPSAQTWDCLSGIEDEAVSPPDCRATF